MQLYPYQIDCINALWSYWKEKPYGSPLLVCPTGSGKSFICASIIQKITIGYPKFKFLVVSHTKEIIKQNSKEFIALTNEPVGIYSAGLNSKTIRRITFGNIQSIYKKGNDLQVDILIVDEAHLISQKTSSMYQKFIDKLKTKNSKLRIVGLTATPMRMDQGSLIAEGSTFTDIAYDISVRRLIDEGFLCPVISMQKEAVDLTGVKTSGYDYNQTDLELAFNKEKLIEIQCKDIIKAAKDRKHWLIFCTGIDHSKAVAEELIKQGIVADHVNGEMINLERDLKIRNFENGKIQALCNVGILTTGFNFRGIDLIVILRSTKSASLYIQSVGRGTRTFPNKLNCMVLDYGGCIERHGPIDLITIRAKKDKKGEVIVQPHKSCPMCGCVVAIRTLICPACEYPFPDPVKELSLKPSTAAILSEVEELLVTDIVMKRHRKTDKPDSFKIEYRCGLKNFSDYLCFEHGGFATQQAAKKWWQRGGAVPSPKTVTEAIERSDELAPVESIRVIKRKQFHEILSVKIGERKTEIQLTQEREELAEELAKEIDDALYF